ncbi:hypothetical protein BDV3_000488 [Batrachochytrium dendrobatidis]
MHSTTGIDTDSRNRYLAAPPPYPAASAGLLGQQPDHLQQQQHGQPHTSESYRRKVLESISRSFTTGSLSKSFAGSLKSLSRNDGFFEAVYNFQFGACSPAILSPARDLEHFAGLEDQFCKDFTCCGKQLHDLHELLQHFEENHVHIESDDADDDLPFEFESIDEMDTDMSDGDTSMNFTDIYFRFHPSMKRSTSTASNASAFKLNTGQTQSVALSDIYADSRLPCAATGGIGSSAIALGKSGAGHSMSAFDTSIIRKRNQHAASKSRRHKHQISHEPVTIPFCFDGPTQVVRDHSMDDSMAIDVDGTTPTDTLEMDTCIPDINAMDSTKSMSDAFSAAASNAQRPSGQALQQRPLLSRTLSCDKSNMSLATNHSLPQVQILSHSNNENHTIAHFALPAHESRSTVSTGTISSSTLAAAAAGTPLSIVAPSVESNDSEDNGGTPKDERPYKCKIDGCFKAYKNPGGLKYHMQHGHCEDTGDPEMNNIIHKPYQCTVSDCGKRYKNLNGLKYHIEHSHYSLLGV